MRWIGRRLLSSDCRWFHPAARTRQCGNYVAGPQPTSRMRADGRDFNKGKKYAQQSEAEHDW